MTEKRDPKMLDQIRERALPSLIEMAKWKHAEHAIPGYILLGRYDKDRPALAFSRLGPLARRFPHAQTVRFHLGLLLIYFGDLPRARRELGLARAEGSRTLLGKRAETLLEAGRKP